MFVCLINNSNSIPSLNLTITQMFNKQFELHPRFKLDYYTNQAEI